MIRVGVLVVAMLAACERARFDDDAFAKAARDIDEVERVERRDRQHISDLSAAAGTLRVHARQLANDWMKITAEFAAATAAYERARVIGEQAAAEFDEAGKTYAQAAREFRVAATVIILAAASDALGSEVCGEMTSRRAFRARLRAEGASLDGIDVDHVWPRALGGADHPLNYQLLGSSLNRSLGAGVIDKIASQPLATLQGLVVSALVTLGCG